MPGEAAGRMLRRHAHPDRRTMTMVIKEIAYTMAASLTLAVALAVAPALFASDAAPAAAPAAPAPQAPSN
jgi:hypothetical protein